MQASTAGTQRVFWPDLIRGVSIVLVILIHVSSPVLNQWEDLPLGEWMAGNIYDSLARVSVPLLFMVSGYLLLGHQEGIFDFYRKRLRKVVIPLVVWSVIYLVWEEGYGNYTVFNAAKAITLSILTKPASYHMWFLYELLLIYMFVPLLRVLTRPGGGTHMAYFAGIWVFFGPVLDIVQESLGFAFAFDLGFLTSYIGYFVLGYLLGQLKSVRVLTMAAGLIFISSLLFTIRATYTETLATGDFDGFYYQYLRLNIALMSVSAFLLLKSLGERLSSRGGNALVWGRRIAQASFGIYLIHILVLTIIRRGDLGFQISVLSGPAAWLVPLVTILVFLISWLMVALLQKIPVLKAIVPN